MRSSMETPGSLVVNRGDKSCGDRIALLLEHVNAENTCIIGNSMGGGHRRSVRTGACHARHHALATTRRAAQHVNRGCLLNAVDAIVDVAGREFIDTDEYHPVQPQVSLI